MKWYKALIVWATGIAAVAAIAWFTVQVVNYQPPPPVIGVIVRTDDVGSYAMYYVVRLNATTTVRLVTADPFQVGDVVELSDWSPTNLWYKQAQLRNIPSKETTP